MPLSEHEKRLLEQIEQTLGSEDPGLASSLRSARPRASNSMLLMAALAALIAGLGVVLVGLRLNSNVGTVIGVIGYLTIVAAGEGVARLITRVRSTRGRGARAASAGSG
jgi:hypothetical protein